MNRLFNKKTNNMTGITLIALVITIIVLLILAGVTVATITGENGLLSKAQLAKERNIEAEQDEKDKLSSYENELSNYSITTRDYTPISYSTDKQDTGLKWTNNKTIYQKSFNLTTTDDYDIQGLNIDTMIDIRGIIHDTRYDFPVGYSDGDGWRANVYYNRNTHILKLYTERVTLVSADITIWYTQTTPTE